MELSQKEWTSAIEAADKCLKVLPTFYEMKHFKTDALLKLGLDFTARLREKAERLWRQAVDELKLALKSPDAIEPGERAISALRYRTLIICLDLLGDMKALNQFFQPMEGRTPRRPGRLERCEARRLHRTEARSRFRGVRVVLHFGSQSRHAAR